MEREYGELNEEVASELEAQFEEIQNLNASIQQNYDVISALAESYICIYYVDLSTGQFQELNKASVEAVNKVIGETGDAKTKFIEMSEYLVTPEFKEPVLEFCDLSNLPERLKDKTYVSIEFFGPHAGWCEGSFIAAHRDTNGVCTHVVWAVRSIQKIKDEEIERANKLDAALTAEKESTEALNQIHELFGSAPWQFEYDETGKETKVEFSDGIRHLLGYENEEDFPNSIEFFLSRVYPADHDRIVNDIYGALEKTGKESVGIASWYRAYKKDGTLRWYRVRGIIKRRENGSPEISRGVVMDVTDFEEAEINQRQALEAFEAVHDALGSANWQMKFDRDGKMTDCIWSDRFRKMIGYNDLEDFPDKLSSWTNLLHPDDKDRVLKAYWAAVNDLTGATVYSVRYRILTKTKGYCWFSAHGSLTRYEDGTPKIYYGLFLNIHDMVVSERKMEMQLKEITTLNSRLEKNQNRLEEAAAEQEAQIEEITSLNEQLEKNQNRLEEAAAEQEAQLEEITALNIKVREEQEAADAANQAKTTFLFNMSHDIRTPMNAIIGFRDLLEKHQEDPERRQDYLNKIGDASTVLLSIINNVLEMARIESGKAELDETVCPVGGIAREISAIFEEQMAKKEIKYTSNVVTQTQWAFYDKAKVREIYLNILSNALKYTDPGGTVSMQVNELPSDEPGTIMMKAVFTDTGIGMSEEFLPHLFEEFSRERTSTESQQQGTGLGMPIVKKIVELIGGTIEVESVLGEGTTFTVIYPLRVEGAQPDETEEEDKKEKTDFAGRRLLLAEDNELNAEIAIEILEEAGFAIDRAEDGQICVEMLKNSDPGYYDLILMDVQMPNMNGYEATRAIRKFDDAAKANIKILAMTANAFEEDKREALRAGMNGHIAKPIDISKLMRTLDEMIG